MPTARASLYGRIRCEHGEGDGDAALATAAEAISVDPREGAIHAVELREGEIETMQPVECSGLSPFRDQTLQVSGHPLRRSQGGEQPFGQRMDLVDELRLPVLEIEAECRTAPRRERRG